MGEKGFGKFVLEVLLVLAVLVGVVALCDARRVFAPDDSNNHIAKKWHYLYLYAAQKKPIDVLVVGNSHTYTGLVPQRIKRDINLNCFLLAAPGVTMDDCSYMLEEALTLFKPKLVVLETYPIHEYEQKKLTAGNLSDQFSSFASRRNVLLKLRSTLKLFSLENAPFAWSATLRNHDILFDKPALLANNLQHPEGPSYDPAEEYFGVFSRFTTGLTEKTLERYRKEGAPVDGSTIRPGEDAARATERMLDMCRREGIPVMFLTIPMYHEHVSGAQRWHYNLQQLIGNLPWLDLQMPEYDNYFGPDCFEDTYNENQHQTKKGAWDSTDILEQFIGYLVMNKYVVL